MYYARWHRFEAISNVLLCGVQGCEKPATHYLLYMTLVGEQRQLRCLECASEAAERIGIAKPILGQNS